MTAEASPDSGYVKRGEHYFRLRVYYEDTDAGGIVYHSRYLNFAERARTEMLRIAGIGQREVLARDGLAFAVRDLSIDYLRAARLDDQLLVRSRVVEQGAAPTADPRAYPPKCARRSKTCGGKRIFDDFGANDHRDATIPVQQPYAIAAANCGANLRDGERSNRRCLGAWGRGRT